MALFYYYVAFIIMAGLFWLYYITTIDCLLAFFHCTLPLSAHFLIEHLNFCWQMSLMVEHLIPIFERAVTHLKTSTQPMSHLEFGSPNISLFFCLQH